MEYLCFKTSSMSYVALLSMQAGCLVTKHDELTADATRKTQGPTHHSSEMCPLRYMNTAAIGSPDSSSPLSMNGLRPYASLRSPMMGLNKKAKKVLATKLVQEVHVWKGGIDGRRRHTHKLLECRR
eukprot:GHRQ01036616.1.p1 GENE.GHRQ01036616.1~~GHRQ01036616.1.p1  ORF type:complete len:126 (+),score=18.58 GHRQ01036616.1:323-700(+)